MTCLITWIGATYFFCFLSSPKISISDCPRNCLKPKLGAVRTIISRNKILVSKITLWLGLDLLCYGPSVSYHYKKFISTFLLEFINDWEIYKFANNNILIILFYFFITQETCVNGVS